MASEEAVQKWKECVRRAGERGLWALHTALREDGPDDSVDYEALAVEEDSQHE